MKEEKTTKRNSSSRRVIIQIERFQHLLDALDDSKKVRRVGFSITLIGVLLFLAVTFIMLSLKSFFPYNEITTSAFGTTTVTDEKKEVSYFLFNTAELWANSGIEVQKGDIISIHSSGTSNTAIHHIDDGATNNTVLRSHNTGPAGHLQKEEKRSDELRGRYRIFPKYNQNALVMQVVQQTPLDVPDSASANNFYFIGAQRENIHIANSGTLYFAVNDIVLTQETILKMMLDNIAVIAELNPREARRAIYGEVYKTLGKPLLKATARKDSSLVKNIFRKDTIIREYIPRLSFNEPDENNNLKSGIDRLLSKPEIGSIYSSYVPNPGTFKFGGYRQKNFDAKAGHKTEMDYYFEESYKQAWFDDNVGSFLILVEKDNRNKFSNGK